MQHLYTYMSMLANLCCLMFLILLIIVYYRKRSINNTENYIYKRMLNANLLFLLVEFMLFSLGIFMPTHMNIILAFEKLYLYCSLECILIFIYYIYTVTNIKYSDIKENLILYRKFIIVRLILVIIMFLLPIKHHMEGGYIQYSYGADPMFMALCSMIAMVFGFVTVFKNRKTIDKKKVFPLYVFVILMTVFFGIHYFEQRLFLSSLSITLISYLMFFTIENPDMKLLEEVHKSKEISDAANEEKTLFLYNMTQEIRNTTNEINDNVDMILESESIDENKEYAREIKGITSKFNSMTNELFDVSKLDAASIKVYNSKYNIKNILKEIVTLYSDKCNQKQLDFRVNIDHDVPEVLYGDSIGLKEVLNIIMDNSIKYTKEGFVEFNVNTIVKKDICRLIITIEDSGVGIKSEDINMMKINDKSLNKANKLVTLMNGAMIVSSNYGIGTKVKVILDQKIEFNKNEDVLKYEEIYNNIKLLMVDDSDSGIKIIDKIVKGSNIKMDFAMSGKECIDKIKAYDKYDIILLDEQLSQISANELIKKIKNIRNFDIPVVLLTKDNSYEYNDEFKKLGFCDYILKPVKKEDLLNKVKLYVKKDR